MTAVVLEGVVDDDAPATTETPPSGEARTDTGTLQALPVTPEAFLQGLHAPGQEGVLELRYLNGQGAFQDRTWVPWPPDPSTGVVLPPISPDVHTFYGLALRREAGQHKGAGGAANCHDTDLLNVDLDLKQAADFLDANRDVLIMTPLDLRSCASQLARSALAHCQELGLHPAAVIYTGHGIQILWRLPAPVSHAETRAYNRQLGSLFGAAYGYDQSTSDVARVLRLPGSNNVKNPARPLRVEVWHHDPGSSITTSALNEATSPPTAAKPEVSAPQRQSVIEAYNSATPITDLLERHGYRRVAEDRYTRPGEDASGGDVHLLRNSSGVLCSYHHSSNDPLTGTPGDGHLRDPFSLFTDLECDGNVKEGVRRAAHALGLGQPGKTPKGKAQAAKGSEEGDDGEKDEPKRPPAGTRAVLYVQEDGAVFWRDCNGEAHMSIGVDGHEEHYRVPSRAAHDLLRATVYRRERRALSATSLSEATSLIATMGRVDGPVHVTSYRVMHHEGCTYIDLGDDTWQVVVVTADGWRVQPSADCPVRFVRSAGMLPLPVPVPGGNLTELSTFLNGDDLGQMMFLAWLVACISGMGPYPLLALGGEEGTGKSTTGSVLRRLLDPHRADRRRVPTGERDLYIAATTNYVLLLDNLSTIPPALSDALCVLSTGGAFTTRTLYSDSEETILEAKRPVIINGIPDLLARPDLAERALSVTLPRITAQQRTTETEFWARFHEAQPRLFGALLTTLAGALNRLPETQLTSTPRLADFARLIVAAEPDMPWAPGAFLQTYTSMQQHMAASLLDDEWVAETIRVLLDEVGEWTGTVKDLLAILTSRLPVPAHPPKGWPTTPKGLGEHLRRLAAALNKVGYRVTPYKRSNRGERYRLRKEAGATYTITTEAANSVQDAATIN